MSLSSLRQHRIFRSLGVTRTAFAVAGVLGFTLVATQIGGAGTANAMSFPYHTGYYLSNGWLCLGWTNGSYHTWHCTHHWHRTSSGALVSDNPAWVPNAGGAAASSSQSTVTHSTASSAPAAPAAQPASSGSVASMIQSTFGPYAGAAMTVARCESGLNPNAVNASSGATGVFQFLAGTWAGTSYAGYSRTNAWANIHAAYQVFSRDGHSWREWVCQP